MFPFELDFLKLLETVRTDVFNVLFESITLLGEETLLIALMAVIYFLYDKQLARKLFIITVLSLTTNSIIKNFVRIPRPFADGKLTCVRPQTATGYSFPSGHTQNFATWSFSLALHFKKHWACILSILLTLLMAFSRMYLGAHYPSDVLVGLLLGISFAVAGSYVCSKTDNIAALSTCALLLLTPFAVYFLIAAEALFADFFKAYGLLAGFLCGTCFEEKYVRLDCTGALWKRFLRVVLAVVLAVLIKTALKKLFACELLRLSLISDAVRYFLLTLIMLGICPLLFQKFKL